MYFKHLDKDRFVYDQVNNIVRTNGPNIERCSDIDWDHDTIPNILDACPNSTPEDIAKGIMLEGSRKGCPKEGEIEAE